MYNFQFFVTIESVMCMKTIGIICEYNPFHNGHLYHLEKIREMYEECTIVLVLGGYFLERGEVSVMSKWNKTALALKYGVDLIVELPVLYGTNAGDYFAYYAVKILAECGVDTIVFGSECDDVELLKNIAISQSDEHFNEKVKEQLKKGTNYPSSLAGVLEVKLESNDLLGVSYIKAIMSIDEKIEPVTIKRTNSFDDLESDEEIVSAQNIRAKLTKGEKIEKFIPDYEISLINEIDYELYFTLLRHRIMTEKHLDRYLGVDEGLENRLKSIITEVSTYDELLDGIKSKRYTTSRLRRMLVHILLGIEKDDMKEEFTQYKILGFNNRGKEHLRKLDSSKLVYRSESRIREIENTAATLYEDLTHDESARLDFINKPIIKD